MHQLAFFFLLEIWAEAKAVAKREAFFPFFIFFLRTTRTKKERQSFSKMQKTGKVDIIVSSIILHRTSSSSEPSLCIWETKIVALLSLSFLAPLWHQIMVVQIDTKKIVENQRFLSSCDLASLGKLVVQKNGFWHFYWALFLPFTHCFELWQKCLIMKQILDSGPSFL